MKKIIYLASPYSNSDASIRIKNFHDISKFAAKLVKEGNIVFSPITYGHTLLSYEDLPTDYLFWVDFCLSFLVKCDELHVYMMPGWDKSVGVQDEISFARDHDIPIVYIHVQ